MNTLKNKKTNSNLTVLFIFLKKRTVKCVQKQTLLVSHAEQSWICSLAGIKSTTVNLGGIIS